MDILSLYVFVVQSMTCIVALSHPDPVFRASRSRILRQPRGPDLKPCWLKTRCPVCHPSDRACSRQRRRRPAPAQVLPVDGEQLARRGAVGPAGSAYTYGPNRKTKAMDHTGMSASRAKRSPMDGYGGVCASSPNAACQRRRRSVFMSTNNGLRPYTRYGPQQPQGAPGLAGQRDDRTRPVSGSGARRDRTR